MSEWQDHIDIPPGAEVFCDLEVSEAYTPPLFRLCITVNGEKYFTPAMADKDAVLRHSEELLQQLQQKGNGSLVEYAGKKVGNA